LHCAVYPSVQVHAFGLAASDVTADITLEGDASSRNRQTTATVVATFRNVGAVFRELGIRDVGLMMINIEGDEYGLIPALSESGIMDTVENLQIQFHLIQDGDRERYDATKALLEVTHTMTWRYPFIWEAWARRS
jgi:hypothetical protein